jgi:hypothetical protein
MPRERVDLKAQKIADSKQGILRTASSRVVSEKVLRHYRDAFAGFCEDELAILDGVILESLSSGRR